MMQAQRKEPSPDPGVPKWGNTLDENSVTRHDFWRACYATMLAELPPAEILEFFTAVPMWLRGKGYSTAELIAHLWFEKGEIPLTWNYAVNALEVFLVSKRHDALGFMRKMLFRNNMSTYMPGKIVMSWFYPIMDTIFSVYDPREMIFKLIEIYTENYLPGHLHPRIRKTVAKGWIQSYLMYMGDMHFSGYRNFNFDYIGGEQIKGFPRMLNLPEFEEITYLADCRSPKEIFPGLAGEWSEDGLRFQGRTLAMAGKFGAFADAQGLDIGRYSLADTEILVACQDLFCPQRNRVVIYKGCAYLAPVFIRVVRHKKIGRKEKKLLEHMLSDTLKEDMLFGPEVIRSHNGVLATLEKAVRFVYHIQDESMSVDGIHLTKGVPAKILRHILAVFARDGRTEFGYLEFKREVDISQGQKNANFEVSLYRLSEALKEKCTGVRIEKTGRGRCALKVAFRLYYREE
jgi:hypothetical protein